MAAWVPSSVARAFAYAAQRASDRRWIEPGRNARLVARRGTPATSLVELVRRPICDSDLTTWPRDAPRGRFLQRWRRWRAGPHPSAFRRVRSSIGSSFGRCGDRLAPRSTAPGQQTDRIQTPQRPPSPLGPRAPDDLIGARVPRCRLPQPGASPSPPVRRLDLPVPSRLGRLGVLHPADSPQRPRCSGSHRFEVQARPGATSRLHAGTFDIQSRRRQCPPHLPRSTADPTASPTSPASVDLRLGCCHGVSASTACNQGPVSGVTALPVMTRSQATVESP